MEHHLLLNPADWVFNFFLHAFNTVSSLLDLFLTARPVNIFHFYLPVIFGVSYSIFTLFYGLAGGEGICIESICDPDPFHHPALVKKMSQGIEDEITSTCPTVCASFIYPMLDWSNDPTLAIVVTLGGCVAVPLCYALLWAVYKGRLALWMHLKKSKIASVLVKTIKGLYTIAENVESIGGQRKAAEIGK